MIKQSFVAFMFIGVCLYALHAKTRQNELQGQIEALQKQIKPKRSNPFSGHVIQDDELDAYYSDPKHAKHLERTIQGIEDEITHEDFVKLVSEGLERYDL
jgi:hypothetical protein